MSTNKKSATIRSKKTEAMKARYLELKAQDKAPGKIIEIIGDEFFLSRKRVYGILKIRRNKLDRKQRVKTVIPQ